MSYFNVKIPQIDFCWVSVPDPIGGAHSLTALLRPLAGFRGEVILLRGGRNGKVKEGKGGDGRGK